MKIPPRIPRIYRAVFPARPMIFGNYATWSNAKARAGSYEAPQTLARVLAGALAVKNGHAAFERDSVTFAKPELNGPLVSALGYVACASGGGVRVLDFGGALGASYYQSRTFLAPKAILSWDIVEQPNFVSAGREHFADSPLRFFNPNAEVEVEVDVVKG